MLGLKTLRVHLRQFLVTGSDFNAISYNQGSENIVYSLTTYDLRVTTYLV